MPRVIGLQSPPPSRVLAKTKSDQAHRKLKSETVTTALRLTGRTTDQKVRKVPAPSMREAAISSPGMPDMNAVKIMTPNGTAMVESATIRPHQELSNPRSRKMP